MTEIPEHLRKRAAAYRQRAGSPGESFIHDPFQQKRTDQVQAAERLATAKVALIAALSPIDGQLGDTPTKLKAQYVHAEKLQRGSPFTPRDLGNAAATLTIYGKRATYTEIADGKSLRIGEEHAWRAVVPKRDIGPSLKGAGLRPILDALKLARRGSLVAEGESMNPGLVKEVFENAAAERVTRSLTIFEGSANTEDYDASYGRRYGVSATITRNPATLSDEDGAFGVDFRTLDSRLRLDEVPFDDGTRMDLERVAVATNPFRRPMSGQMDVLRGLEVAADIISAYGALVDTPTQAGIIDACQLTDSVFSRR